MAMDLSWGVARFGAPHPSHSPQLQWLSLGLFLEGLLARLYGCLHQRSTATGACQPFTALPQLSLLCL